jgi:beta-lactamase regulating signal transducer with metallopeptidase domain
MTIISNFTTRTIVVYDSKGFLPSISYMNSIMAAYSYFPIVYKTNLLEFIFQISSIVWVIVMCASLLSALLLYCFTKREIRDAEHLQNNIYISDKITAPALYGIIKPKILLPRGISSEDISYIILHEKVHAQRHDNLWRVAAIIVCCIHWFNPLIWICLKYFFEDMELSCDSRVLKAMGTGEHKRYANTILNCSTQRSLFVTAFGGAKVKVRIENILSYRRLTAAACISFGLLLAAIITVLLTNAQI